MRFEAEASSESADKAPSGLDKEAGITFEVVEPAGPSNGKTPRRGVYLLPNLLTTGALFCGFYAIVASFNGLFEKAAFSLFAAMILDGLDGRVARLTNTQSAFGAQYDSLSDLVAFGVAPAVMIYAWSLAALDKVGWMAGFIWVACAALRLARFNVQTDDVPRNCFLGLPSPAAAAVVGAYVWMGFDMPLESAGWSVFSAILTLWVAVLMVSNVQYPSFKECDLRGRVPFVSILAAVMIFGVVFIDPPKVLLVCSAGYAMFGMLMAFKTRFLSR